MSVSSQVQSIKSCLWALAFTALALSFTQRRNTVGPCESASLLWSESNIKFLLVVQCGKKYQTFRMFHDCWQERQGKPGLKMVLNALILCPHVSNVCRLAWSGQFRPVSIEKPSFNLSAKIPFGATTRNHTYSSLKCISPNHFQYAYNV